MEVIPVGGPQGRVTFCARITRSLFQKDRFRFTHFLPPGKVPGVWKACALVGLRRIDRAFNPVEKDAFLVRLLNQCQPLAIRSHLGVAFNELIHRHLQIVRNGIDFAIAHDNFARPLAAIAAALTLIKDVLGICHRTPRNPKRGRRLRGSSPCHPCPLIG